MIEKSFERQHNLAVAARVKMVLRLFNELKLYCPEGWCHQHETIIMNSHYISGLFFHSLNKERLLCTVFLFVTRNCGRCFYRHCHHNHSSVFGLNDYICWPKTPHIYHSFSLKYSTLFQSFKICSPTSVFSWLLSWTVQIHEKKCFTSCSDDWQDWMIRLLLNLHCELHFTSSPAHSVLPDNGKLTWLALREGGLNPRLDLISE